MLSPIGSTMSHLLTRITTLLARPLLAQEPMPQKAETFDVSGHKAVRHAAPKPAQGKPWVGFAPTLNGGGSLAGRPMYVEAFMKAGIGRAGLDLGKLRGSPAHRVTITQAFHLSATEFTLGQHRQFDPKHRIKKAWHECPLLLRECDATGEDAIL